MIALTLGSPAAMDRVPQCGGVTSRKEGDFARPGGRGGAPAYNRRLFRRCERPAGFVAPWGQKYFFGTDLGRAEREPGRSFLGRRAPAGEIIIMVSPAIAV